MSRLQRPSALWLAAAGGLGFVAGLAVMSVSPRPAPEPIVEARSLALEPPATVGDPPAAIATSPALDPVTELRQRGLALPVAGLGPDDLRDTFGESRGDRRHEALDILAPRDTPVLAVEAGSIAKLFLSKPGGITIYQFDPTSTYAYYYAHLSRYADGLKEGARVERGQVIGYVGTTGNAPPETPHLHFAIFQLTDAKRWWEGTAIDPYPIFR